MSYMSLANRVERGARLLDKQLPGWADLVDPNTLDVAYACSCVLGQAYGDFYNGMDKLFYVFQHARAWTHGFYVRTRGRKKGMLEYVQLTGLWKQAIAVRQIQFPEVARQVGTILNNSACPIAPHPISACPVVVE